MLAAGWGSASTRKPSSTAVEVPLRSSTPTPRAVLSRRRTRAVLAVLSLLVSYVVYRLIVSHATNDLRLKVRRSQSLLGFSPARRDALPPDLVPGPPPLALSQLLQHPLINRPTPECTLAPAQMERYAPLSPAYGSGGQRKSQRGRVLGPHDQPRHSLNYFLALNLYSSSAVLPSLIHAIHAVVSSLGSNRFFVSIYENGSTDDTPAQLYLFARILNELGVGYSIVSSTKPKAFEQDERIAGLAKLRNLALRPLLEAPDGTWDRVVFINDVHLCPADLLELILQHEVQGADQSCGMDYKELRIKEFAKQGYPLLFYDVWVARDMLGLPFYKIKYPSGDWDLPTPPLPHSPSRPRLDSLLPFQVYSCFNGITVISAFLFHPPHSLRFRTINGTDEQSECFLFCRDLWTTLSPFGLPGRKKGRGAKIQIVPRASVAYDLSDYERARNDRNLTAIESPEKVRKMEQDERVDWRPWPPKLVASYPRGHWNEEAWVPPV